MRAWRIEDPEFQDDIQLKDEPESVSEWLQWLEFIDDRLSFVPKEIWSLEAWREWNKQRGTDKK